jgi:ATP-dependent Clp protease ATP-binding subunit ClpA
MAPIKDAVADIVQGAVRPRNCAIFGGPASGKTTLTWAVAEALNHDRNALVLVNMADIRSDEQAILALGTPPEYGSFRTRGIADALIRRFATPVVVFDEIEKIASPKLAAAIDEALVSGCLPLADGEADLRNAIVILLGDIDPRRLLGFLECRFPMYAAKLREEAWERLASRRLVLIPERSEREIADIAKEMLEQRMRRLARRMEEAAQYATFTIDPAIADMMAILAIRRGGGVRSVDHLIRRFVATLQPAKLEGQQRVELTTPRAACLRAIDEDPESFDLLVHLRMHAA